MDHANILIYYSNADGKLYIISTFLFLLSGMEGIIIFVVRNDTVMNTKLNKTESSQQTLVIKSSCQAGQITCLPTSDSPI